MYATASNLVRCVAATVLLSAIASAAGAQYSGGTGTPQDPYQIATAADLLLLGDSPADYGKCFILTADIDLDAKLPGRRLFDKAVIAPATIYRTDPNWPTKGDPFVGVLDGSGHKISHLRIVGSDYLGLFGRLDPGAQIRNLAVVDVDIVGSGGFVGGLVGSNAARLDQCYSTGQVGSGSCVGGLVGENRGSIRNCYSTCAADANESVGGLVGSNPGSVMECYSAGRVTGRRSAGGLVGSASLPDAVRASFWDTDMSVQADSAGGLGQDTFWMWTEATFLAAGWDFVGETANGTQDIWRIDKNEDYPHFSWEPQASPPVPVTEPDDTDQEAPPLAPGPPVDETEFEAEIAHGVVLVDFYAWWCSHCQDEAPVVQQVAGRVQGQASVVEVDVDTNRDIGEHYGIQGYPTLVVFQEGREVSRFVGATSADVLVAAILSAVASSGLP